MRLIGNFETENEAYIFYSFLLKEGIQNIYEPFTDEKTPLKQYHIWVYDEDDLDRATEWLERYRQNPKDSSFQSVETPKTRAAPPTPEYREVSEAEDLKWQKIPTRAKRRLAIPLTHFIILLCGILFLWNDFQEDTILKEKGELAVQFAITPLQQDLLFDLPRSYGYIQEMIDQVPLSGYKDIQQIPKEANSYIKQAHETPSWKGIIFFFQVAKKQGWKAATAIPLFEKIRQGQLWRLLTPSFLHSEFLHILFNMIWAWLLLKQIEERLPKLKLICLIVIIGILSNLAQYLVSGPYFLGFSGVVVGLAGFIWVRQKKAPWEGYPLQRSTALFLLFFVIAMVGVELLTLTLHLFSSMQLPFNIANTAHVVGGIVGLLLGRFSFFSRRMP